uniref:Protein kinase domain-containing protein n=1 Tax=Heterorhabditis bacteriophora TaxID=37862 RepID=A0A1I7WW45_HETBA
MSYRDLREARNFSLAPSYCSNRQLKYEWLFKNNRTFRRNVQTYLGSKDLYASASHDIHKSFHYGSEVIIRECNYQKDQLSLLEAICQTLNLRIKSISRNRTTVIYAFLPTTNNNSFVVRNLLLQKVKRGLVSKLGKVESRRLVRSISAESFARHVVGHCHGGGLSFIMVQPLGGTPSVIIFVAQKRRAYLVTAIFLVFVQLLRSSTTSRVVLHGSTSTMASVGCRQSPKNIRDLPHLQSARLRYEVFEGNVDSFHCFTS